jgi:chlorobactene glucosyltransferase
LTTLAIISTVLMLVGLYLTWLVHSRSSMEYVVDKQAELPGSAANQQLPFISVIIPARNEQRNIRHCISSVLRQDYPNFEIICVDDHSSDGTAGILAELAESNPSLQVIHGAELPAGWAGKPHALVQGVALARGEWLCFMDADTFASPELLRASYHIALRLQADMFSILTAQVLGSFWERAVLPLVFLGLSFGFPAKRVNDPSRPDAISNGQFILIRRQAYEAIGGHSAVIDRIDEDRALALLAKQAGKRLVLADGRQVASTRMYTSLGEMWEGWTKNIYLGLLDKLWLLSFGALLGLAVSILLPAWLIGSIAWLISEAGAAAMVVAGEALVMWAFLLAKRQQACRGFGIPGWYAFTFPMGAFIFTAMMLASAVNVISGRGVTWKGRRYQ